MARAEDERTTERMAVVTLSDLMCAHLEPPPPPDPDTFDPPTNPRNRLFAKGTEQSLRRIAPDDPYIHPSRLPTEPMAAVEAPEWTPLDDDEVEVVLAPLNRP